MPSNKIQGVEIFSAGTWNGDKFDIADLNAMVEAFNQTSPGIRPFLKLGHDDEQKLLQKDGLPAAGWIERLYVQGEKLMADFYDVPNKIYQLIKDGAYKKVSSEIFYNLTVNDRKYQYLLGAVALLGADTPGVMNLSDIMAAYYKKFSSEPPKNYNENALELKFNNNHERKDFVMTPEEKAKLELEAKTAKEALEAKDKELKQFTLDKEAKDKEIADLKQFKLDAEKREAQLALEKEQAQIKQFVTELKADKLCTPSMEGMISELLGPEKKEYTVSKDKKGSKQEALKEALKLFKAASEVNFEENSEGGEKDGKVNAKAQEEKIEKYMAEHEVSYTKAVKALGLLKSE